MLNENVDKHGLGKRNEGGLDENIRLVLPQIFVDKGFLGNPEGIEVEEREDIRRDVPPEKIPNVYRVRKYVTEELIVG